MKSLPLLLAALSVTTATSAQGACRVELTDRFNDFSATISVDQTTTDQKEIFTVLNRQIDKNPIELVFEADRMVYVNAGVPMTNLSEIESRYGAVSQELLEGKSVNQRDQLLWRALDSSTCTTKSLSIIQFLVFEWYYFG